MIPVYLHTTQPFQRTALIAADDWNRTLPNRLKLTVIRRLGFATVLGAIACLPPQAAHASPSWLSEINRYRAATGLSAVSDQPAWDAGIDHHLTYLEKTSPGFFTGQYQSAHSENPASPHFTSDGALEATKSDLVQGGASSPGRAVDIWLAAPFHAIGMLRAQLTQIALADHASTGFAGLDVIRGVNFKRRPATAPILFPGPGITTNLLRFDNESPDPLETCGWQRGAVGLPLIILLPRDPVAGLTSSLSGPHGTESTADGTLCIVDRYTYHSSDVLYGSTGVAILKSDHAVLLIPRDPLVNGSYSVSVRQPGRPDIDWSFSALAAAGIAHTRIRSIQIRGHRVDIKMETRPGTKLRCALTPYTGKVWQRDRYRRCRSITAYQHVTRGQYRFRVRSSAGNGMRHISVR